MPIEFHCGQCGRLLQAGGAPPGHRILCPGCGAFSTVPAPQGGPFAAEPDDSENPYQAPTQYGTYEAPMQYVGPVMPTDTRAIASLVLGICGCVCLFCCPLLGLPLGVTGLVLGAMARKSPNRGMAIAGMILCGIQVALALLYVLAMVVFLGLAASAPGPGGW